MYKFDNELARVYCDDKKRYLFDLIKLEEELNPKIFNL